MKQATMQKITQKFHLIELKRSFFADLLVNTDFRSLVKRYEDVKLKILGKNKQ